MRKQVSNFPNPNPHTVIELGKKYLNTYQLEAALTTMQEMSLHYPINQKNHTVFQAQLLLCQILISKSRFSGDTSFTTLALSKLEALKTFLPLEADSEAPISVTILQAEAYIQQNDYLTARRLAKQLLLFSKTINHAIGKITAYHLLGEIAIEVGDIAAALMYAQNAHQLLLAKNTSSKLDSLLAANYMLLGQVYFLQSDYEQAIRYSDEAIALSVHGLKLEENHIQSLLLLAYCAQHKKEYTKAMKLLLQAKDKSEAIQHNQLNLQTELAIGTLYNVVCGYDKAIQRFETIQSNGRFFLNQRKPKLRFYIELGKAYYYTKQYGAAKELFEAVLEQTTSTYENLIVIALAYLGSIATIQEDFRRGLQLAKKCNQAIQKLGKDTDGLSVNLINLGSIHYQLKKYNESIKLTSRGIAAAKRLQDETNEIKGFQLMGQIFNKQKDYKNAFLYQTIYTKFYEDFFEKNQRQVLSDLEQEYLLRKAIENTKSINKMYN